MSRPALTPPQTNIIRRGTWVLWELLLLDQFLSFHARKAKIFTSLVHLLAILSAQHTVESAIHNKETPQKVPTPARHRNPLCLVRAYPIATKSTMLIKITMYIYLHARTHQPVHTQVKRRNLPRPIRAHTIRGKPTILCKMTIQFYLHAGIQRSMPTQIRRLNPLRQIKVYTPRKKPTILSRTAIHFYLNVQRIVSTRIRRRNLLRLFGPTPSAKVPNIFNEIIIQIHLHVGTQQKMHTQTIAATCCAMSGPTPTARKQTNQQNTILSLYWEAANNVDIDTRMKIFILIVGTH